MAHEVDAPVIEVAAVHIEQGGMLLTVVELDPALFIGQGINRVEPLECLKHLFGRSKEIGSIVLLLEVKFFVTLLVLLLLGIKEREPYLVISTVSRVFQQVGHELLGRRKVIALLNKLPGLGDILLLGISRQA